MRALLIVLIMAFFAVTAPAQEFWVEKLTPVPLEKLSKQARERVSARPAVELMPPPSDRLSSFDTLEPRASGRIPNYLRALSPATRVNPMARLLKTVLYSGTIRPEIKMAMGLRTAQLTGNGYQSRIATPCFLRRVRSEWLPLLHVASGSGTTAGRRFDG